MKGVAVIKAANIDVLMLIRIYAGYFNLRFLIFLIVIFFGFLGVNTRLKLNDFVRCGVSFNLNLHLNKACKYSSFLSAETYLLSTIAFINSSQIVLIEYNSFFQFYIFLL